MDIFERYKVENWVDRYIRYCNKKWFKLDESLLPKVKFRSNHHGTHVFNLSQNMIFFNISTEVTKKDIRHEMIHWYLYQSGENADHTKGFMKWSRKLRCGDVFIQRGVYPYRFEAVNGGLSWTVDRLWKEVQVAEKEFNKLPSSNYLDFFQFYLRNYL